MIWVVPSCWKRVRIQRAQKTKRDIIGTIRNEKILQRVKSALWVQLVKVKRCKKQKKKREGEDNFRDRRRRGRERWMSRRATGGRYRERQEAGQRQTDRKRNTAERSEGKAEQQWQYLSLTLSPGSVAACFPPVKFPSWEDWTVWRKILEWWTAELNICHSGLSLVGTMLPLGIEITNPYREGKNSDRPKITEEWSLSRGKLTHGTIVY